MKPKLLSYSDELEVLATLKAIKGLIWRNRTVPEFENEKKALLNNPQWRAAVAKRRRKP